MMMKAFVILALIGISVAIVLPSKSIKGQKKDGDGGPDCGARSAPKFFQPRPIHKEATFICEMCLDLVQIGEMYADCDEAYVDKKMDEKCDSYFHQGFLDTVCRDLIDDLYKELEADTDKDPAKVCSKVTKTDCHYS
uniref:Saposin B-type domain-containing protein n=1 Tax=Panagrolaimus sp. ES5 TaxID=591445 RepID=A0AC34F8E7_9BILA